MAGPRKSQLGWALGPAWLCVMLALANTAEAQLSIDNVPETLIEAFRFHLDKWSEVLLGFAKKLFFALASIELTMSLARAYYEEGGTFDRVGAVLIKRMLFLGFWSTLLFFGPDGIRNLVDTFAALGASASGQALDPTGILEQGLGLTLELMSLAFDEGVLESAALFFPLTVLAMVFVFATAEVVGALIDAYIVASAGIVMLGFGGSHWTAPMAENYLRTAVGAGIHLMVVNLVAAVGMRAVLEIAYVIKGVGDADFPGLVAVVLYVTGAAMLFAYLASTRPRDGLFDRDGRRLRGLRRRRDGRCGKRRPHGGCGSHDDHRARRPLRLEPRRDRKCRPSKPTQRQRRAGGCRDFGRRRGATGQLELHRRHQAKRRHQEGRHPWER